MRKQQIPHTEIRLMRRLVSGRCGFIGCKHCGREDQRRRDTLPSSRVDKASGREVAPCIAPVPHVNKYAGVGKAQQLMAAPHRAMQQRSIFGQIGLRIEYALR